jgi:hypothetical protein
LKKWIAILGSFLAISQSAKAENETEMFFKTSQIQIIIGYGPGGAYDAYGRTLARHIGRYLPGKPNISIQNMPGAGSMKAANYIATLAPKNGSQIATFSRGLILQPLLDPLGVQYDPRQLEWIGSVASETSVIFAWHSRNLDSFEDVYRKEMIVSASGSGADSAIFPYVLNAVLGTKFKVITGYPDANGTMMAIERGEADGSAGTSWSTLSSTRPDWISNKRIKVLAQIGLTNNKSIAAPLILDFAKSDMDKRVLELIFSRQALAYPFTAPQGVPPDRLDAWRKAFEATMVDAEFVTEANKAGLEVAPTKSESIKEIIAQAYDSKPDVIRRAQIAISDGTASK